MAAGSGPVRTSIRPNTLSTVFFITAIGLIQTVIGTTCTDTIADNQKQAQRELSHERVSAPSQTGRPSLPQLDACVKPAKKRQIPSPSATETSPQTELLGDTVHSMPSSPPREKLSSPSQLLSSPLSSRPHPQACVLTRHRHDRQQCRQTPISPRRRNRLTARNTRDYSAHPRSSSVCLFRHDRTQARDMTRHQRNSQQCQQAPTSPHRHNWSTARNPLSSSASRLLPRHPKTEIHKSSGRAPARAATFLPPNFVTSGL